MMFCTAYSAFSDRMVVNDPAPTMRGNTNGTMLVSPFGPSPYLKIFTSNSISKPMAKITIEPATANDSMSTLKNKYSITKPLILVLQHPVNLKNASYQMNETLKAGIGPVFFCRSIIIGIEPAISRIAKRTTNAPRISLMSKFMTGYYFELSEYLLAIGRIGRPM